MRKTVYICDRCGEEFNEINHPKINEVTGRSEEFYGLIESYDTKDYDGYLEIHTRRHIDLCQECFDELQLWFRSKKIESEVWDNVWKTYLEEL